MHAVAQQECSYSFVKQCFGCYCNNVVFYCAGSRIAFGLTMPRSKPRKAAGSSAEKKFRVPIVAVRSSRRLTLAGPSQLLSKQSLSPVIMLRDNFLGKIKKGVNVAKSQSETGNKAAVKKMGSKQSPKKVKAVNTSPKPKKVPSPRKSQHTANVKSSPKPSSPKQQKSLTPKSNPESPSHSYFLRSVASPAPFRLDMSKTQSSQKSMNAVRKRDRDMSPAKRKTPKEIAVSEKQKKSPMARKSEMERPVKPTGKRKRVSINENKDEYKLSPPQKKRLLKNETSPAPNKSSKKITNVSFTDVKSKMQVKGISVSQQNSTPVKAKLAENDVSRDWTISSIKKKLLAGVTPYRMKENETPALSSARQRKSALSTAKSDITDTEKHTARRHSVRFVMNGKADTVKELKKKSSRKRFCYRMCQYALLFGLPVAVTVGSVLVYNGLI